MNIESFYKLYKEANNCIIDSRKLQPNDIFFAFSGENYNAAEKAEEVITSGALAVVVEDPKYNNPGRNIFFVESTLQFLQDLSIIIL